MDDLRIEFPSSGATYCTQEYGVYKYSVYPNSSVLAGMTSRQFLDSFNTLEEAKTAYPEANISGCGYVEQSFNHLPGNNDEEYDRDDY